MFLLIGCILFILIAYVYITRQYTTEEFVMLDEPDEKDILSAIKRSQLNDVRTIYTEHNQRSDKEREDELKRVLDKHEEEATTQFNFMENVGESIKDVYKFSFSETKNNLGAWIPSESSFSTPDNQQQITEDVPDWYDTLRGSFRGMDRKMIKNTFKKIDKNSPVSNTSCRYQPCRK